VNFTDIEIIGGADQNNYILQSTTGTGQATINRAPLLVIAEDKSKVYDGEEFSGFTVIYEGFVADEDETVLSGILIFGDEAEDAINAGTYTIQPVGLSSANYNIGYTSATLTIEKAPLLVKADDKSKVYDGQVFEDFTVSYTGFVNVENEDVLGGELQFSGAAKDAINVGSYTIIPSGLTAANYNIDYDEGTLVIFPATLTVTADDKSKVYDKQVFTGFTVQYSGFAEGEDQSVLTGNLEFYGDALSEVNVGQYTIIPEGLSATNYSIDYVPGTLTITPAALTISADNKTKVYDKQVFPAFTVSYDGFAGSDSESDLQGTLSFSGDAFTAVNVGTWEIIPEGLESTNYNIIRVNGSLEITPASLTVTADDKSKVYDAAIFTDFTASYSGFAGSDGPGDLDGALTFGGDAASAVNVGTYTITPGGLLSDNYNISYNSGALNITKAVLTITAEDKSKDYDGQAFTGFTVVYDGFVGGEDETSLEGSLSFDGTAVDAVNAGDYEIIPQGYSSQNYDISYVSGEFIISTVALIVTADNKSKPYDGQEFTDFTVSYAGFVTGENEGDLQGTLSFAEPAVGAINAGSYTIQPQGLTSNNYNISYVNGELTITSILLTVTADDQSKVYDGNPFTGFTLSYDGFVDGEDESVLDGDLEFAGDAVGEINVGSYTIIPSVYTSQNYDIVYENGTLTITTRPLTITANDVNKTVGVELEFDGTEFTATGLVNNGIDQVTSVTLVSAGASADAEVGNYDIIPSNAQGVAVENYSISYVNGTLTVTDKIILALAGTVAEDKVYDGTTIATISDIGILIGVRPGDDVSIDTDQVIANFNNKNADNNKLVTLSNIVLIGDDAVNYTIDNQFASASITLRPLTLFDFAANDRPYDGTTNVTGGTFADDRVTGDVLSFSYNAAFESPDAGTGKTVNFSDIQISGGADANNYQLLTFSGQATADINPIPLTITANDEQKVYDSQVFPEFSVAYSGFITGENEDVLTGTLSFSGEATAAVNTGEYEILPEGLSSNNYIITFVAGTLTITPAELTITADNKSKVYDTQTFDAFTVSYSGFEGGDGPADLDGTLSFAGTAPDAVNAGEYSIIPQGVNSNNYAISFVNGILEITPALLTITADDKSKVYDGQVFNGFTVSYEGFAGNEDESVLQGNLNFSGTAFSAINAGVYQIIPQGVNSGNYNIEFIPGNLTITKAPLVITADNKSKTYNGQVFTAFTVTYSGFVNDESPGVLQGTLSYSGPAVTAINAGEYAIIPQGIYSIYGYLFGFCE